jgi:hypothetical protein
VDRFRNRTNAEIEHFSKIHVSSDLIRKYNTEGKLQLRKLFLSERAVRFPIFTPTRAALVEFSQVRRRFRRFFFKYFCKKFLPDGRLRDSTSFFFISTRGVRGVAESSALCKSTLIIDVEAASCHRQNKSKSKWINTETIGAALKKEKEMRITISVIFAIVAGICQ